MADKPWDVGVRMSSLSDKLGGAVLFLICIIKSNTGTICFMKHPR